MKFPLFSLIAASLFTQLFYGMENPPSSPHTPRNDPNLIQRILAKARRTPSRSRASRRTISTMGNTIQLPPITPPRLTSADLRLTLTPSTSSDIRLTLTPSPSTSNTHLNFENSAPTNNRTINLPRRRTRRQRPLFYPRPDIELEKPTQEKLLQLLLAARKNKNAQLDSSLSTQAAISALVKEHISQDPPIPFSNPIIAYVFHYNTPNFQNVAPALLQALTTITDHNKALRGKDECPICLEIISTDDDKGMFSMKCCANRLHASCFKEYLRKSGTASCLYCRNPIAGLPSSPLRGQTRKTRLLKCCICSKVCLPQVTICCKNRWAHERCYITHKNPEKFVCDRHKKVSSKTPPRDNQKSKSARCTRSRQGD